MKQTKTFTMASRQNFVLGILVGILSIASLNCNIPFTSNGMKMKNRLIAAKWQIIMIHKMEQDLIKQNPSKGYIELSRLVSGNAKFDGKQYYAEGYAFRLVLRHNSDNVPRGYFIVGVPNKDDRLPYGLIMNETGAIWIFDYQYPAQAAIIPNSYTELEDFVKHKCREYLAD